MRPRTREVEYYGTETGRRPFKEWLDGLKDRVGRARIDARITRLQAGLIGKCEPVGGGVFELKDKFGPGYRIYFAEDGRDIILLLCGGNKGSQQADIETARHYWTAYQNRKRNRSKKG